MRNGNVLPPMPRFTTIGRDERDNLLQALRHPLSGYLGGELYSHGIWVGAIEERFRGVFGADDAVACNSATSGLLAACMAAGVTHGDDVWTTPYSMSATAACAVVLGARVKFIDIEPIRFSLDPLKLPNLTLPKVLIVANIFGHPAYLHILKTWCNKHGVVMIEDNAQSPFAVENGRYASTMGHMGVFSFNVHKHIQAGEGGVVLVNDQRFSEKVRLAINHGELAGGRVGLNLRMTEPTAAIACAQFDKAEKIIAGRRDLAQSLTDMVSDIPWIVPTGEDVGCKHVYYLWTATCDTDKRDRFVERLNESGVPFSKGYSTPLNRIFDPSQYCPTADVVEKSLISFEVCAYNPTMSHLRKMREIIKRVAGEIDENR